MLIIDSMRLDIWRQLVQPALEREYAVEETLGMARLPSETQISRRAFFAGKPPAQVPTAGKESDLLADLLSRFHATKITLESARTERPVLYMEFRPKTKSPTQVFLTLPINYRTTWIGTPVPFRKPCVHLSAKSGLCCRGRTGNPRLPCRRPRSQSVRGRTGCLHRRRRRRWTTMQAYVRNEWKVKMQPTSFRFPLARSATTCRDYSFFPSLASTFVEPATTSAAHVRATVTAG